MRLLIVEDEDHKYEDICKCLDNAGIGKDRVLVNSVGDAARLIRNDHFTHAILDMVLPTFTESGSFSSGSQQSLGGQEILRVIARHSPETKVIILSQYPNTDLGAHRLPLEESSSALQEKFNVEILDTVLFDFKVQTWCTKLCNALEGQQ